MATNFNAGPDFEFITAAQSLTAADSGKTFYMNTAGGFTLTLPAVADAVGVNYKFVVKTNCTTEYIIAEKATADTNVILGNINHGATTGSTTGATYINFIATLDVVGDYVELSCDGVKWYASGSATTASAITFT